MRKQCRALLKYMECQEHITGALSAWMEDLLPALNILGNTKLDDQVFTTTFHNYTAVEHLFLIPQILEKIEGYMSDNNVQSDKPVRFAEYNPTISLSSTPSPIPNIPQLTKQLDNPNHPGAGWSKYDMVMRGNTNLSSSMSMAKMRWHATSLSDKLVLIPTL